MKNVRSIYVGALLAIHCSLPSGTYAQTQAKFDLLMREPLSSVEGLDITVTRLEVEPGYTSASHRHPGETFVYIVSGRVLNQIDDEEPKVYEGGDFFFEPANALHAQFVNIDRENSAVVIIVGIRPPGAN
jgi:quercetin dioxygenase-like cupin family protein